MRAYLSAIYADGGTRLGTFARTVAKGNVKRAVASFRKAWQGRRDMHGNAIIGVEVELVEGHYGPTIRKERILF